MGLCHILLSRSQREQEKGVDYLSGHVSLSPDLRPERSIDYAHGVILLIHLHMVLSYWFI